MTKPTKNELLNMPRGIKITTDSKSKGFKSYIKQSKTTFRSELGLIYNDDINEDLTLHSGLQTEYGTKITKIEKPHYETIWEEHEILDEKEKEYLRAVIKPFRKKVECIFLKRSVRGDYITIELELEYISLPYFKSKTMYRGMKLDKRYTLKELGL